MKFAPLILIAALVLAILVVYTPALAQSGGSDTARASHIKAELRDILSASEYHRSPPHLTWLSRAGKWISEKISNFFRWLGRMLNRGQRAAGTPLPRYAFYILLSLLLIGMAFLIAWVIAQIGPGLRGRRRKKLSIEEALEPEETATAEPDAWLEAARRLALAGDFRRAYRAVFIGVLIRLDRLGALQFDRSRTNGEYLRALRSHPELLTFLRPLATDFDARWYGRLPVGEADYQRFLDAYQRVPETASS